MSNLFASDVDSRNLQDFQTFKLYVIDATRSMTSQQVLELADCLHDVMRARRDERYDGQTPQSQVA